jgi:hypothetical protein
MPRERAKERECETSIKKTLAYRAIFKYPLSYYQLCTFLFSNKNYEYLFFNKQLRRLLKSKSIDVDKEKFFIPGIKPISWHSRYKASKEIITKTSEHLALVFAIPWVKMICITGSVAAYNADKGDDVDILIVSTKNRLWLTRLFTVLILKIVNLYPKVDGECGKICANLYIDEEALPWPREKRSIYIAHDIALMQPVYQKDNTYFRFLLSNKWICDYLPKFTFDIPSKLKPNVKGNSKLLDLLDTLVFNIQLGYMKKKKTKEITKKHFIHFNKFDNTQNILNEYDMLLKKTY